MIIGYGEIVRDKLHEADPLRAKVEEILKAGRRAAALTSQLLIFSRQQSPRTENPEPEFNRGGHGQNVAALGGRAH